MAAHQGVPLAEHTNCLCAIPPPSEVELREFIAIKDDFGRFEYADRYRRRYQNEPYTELYMKSDISAIQLLEKGDALLSVGDYTEALSYYNRGVAWAATPAVLARGYAYRSTIFYMKGLRKECIQESLRALAGGLQTNFSDKIKRRIMAVGRLGDHPPYHDQIPVIPEGDRYPTLPCARNCIKFVKTSNAGISVVATRKIEAGEVLLIEDPQAHYVDQNIKYNCHNCLALCFNPIPCSNCRCAIYCSSACKSDAFDEYHEYECFMLPTLSINCISTEELLCLRMVLSRRVNLLREYFIDRRPRYRHNRPIFFLTMVVTLMHSIVKSRSNFFWNMEENIFITHLTWLLIHSGIYYQCLRELSPKRGILQSVPLGFAMHNISNAFRHSCFHNVECHFYRSTLVMYASRPIQPGEHCCISYGPKHHLMNKASRQLCLANCYGIQCTCVACMEDWPPIDGSMPLIQLEYAAYGKLKYQMSTFSRTQIKDLLSVWCYQLNNIVGLEFREFFFSCWQKIALCLEHLANVRRIF